MTAKTAKKNITPSTSESQVNFCLLADALRQKNSYQEAASNYLNAILINRNDENSYYGLGLCYKALENYAKAIKYLEKATEINADFYEAFYELGLCHLAEGIPCGAIKNFVRAIQINPDNPNAILQLGISHEMCEEADMALMIYQKLIENSPKFIKGYEKKADLLMKLNDYKEASLLYNKILKLNPEFYRAYLGIGTCFDKLGKRAEAQRYYRKFLVKKPNSHKAPVVKARLEKLKTLAKSNPLYILD